jgi:hypothetical protein
LVLQLPSIISIDYLKISTKQKTEIKNEDF